MTLPIAKKAPAGGLRWPQIFIRPGHRQLGAVILLILVLAFPMRSQPIVTYELGTARAARLTVTAGKDAAFDQLFQEFRQNPLSRVEVDDSLKPFTFIIKNTSEKTIAMMGFYYERTYADRPSSSDTLVLDTRQKYQPAFKPGQAVFVSPGVQGVGPNLAMTRPSRNADAANRFGTAVSVVAALDCVIFEDGTVVGPDRLGISVRYEAQRQAASDLFDALSALKASGASPSEVAAYVERLAALRPEPARVEGSLSRNGSYFHDLFLQLWAMKVSLLKTASRLDGLITSAAEIKAAIKPLLTANR